jgi:arginyl-tRNA synthetase
MTDTSNIFATVLARVHAALGALTASGALPPLDASRVVVEPPRDAAHGDMATNAAMVLAKDAGKKPRELADLIAEKLRADDLIDKVDVAGPGFINIALKPAVWADALRSAIKAGAYYGRRAPHGGPVNVEYVSANPTGPMHVGHCRGAVFGDALANLLEFAGRNVTREYYINDAGAQVDVLARSAYIRYLGALGEDFAIPEGFYPGEYLIPVGVALATEYGPTLKGKPESYWLPIVRAKSINMMMEMIRDDLAALDVRHDVFFSERSLTQGNASAIASTIEDLRERDLVYLGRLPPPKGQLPDDWEDREQLLFRSTAYKDDVDRPLVKSNGSYTYFAADIAYHRDKFERGFHEMIDVWGADHGGYIKRMEAAVAAISDGKAKFDAKIIDVKVVQLVRLLRGGEPVRMSKRSGDFVTLREVVDEVGKDAVRFMMLYRKNDAVLDFDMDKVKEQSKDNPVFYVQYGHARAYSIFRNAREGLGSGEGAAPAVMPDLPMEDAARAKYLAGAPLELLTDSAELALMKKIAAYPRLIEAAAAAHEPHRVAFYLYELASEFHAQWTRGGKESPHLRFIIQSDPRLTMARLSLVQGVVTVLASGLALLGVGAPEEMR